VCHFYLTCKACRFCRSGRETLCETVDMAHGMRWGLCRIHGRSGSEPLSPPGGIPPEASSSDGSPRFTPAAQRRSRTGDDVLVVGPEASESTRSRWRNCPAAGCWLQMSPMKARHGKKLGAMRS
jgi:hypothetical protein